MFVLRVMLNLVEVVVDFEGFIEERCFFVVMNYDVSLFSFVLVIVILLVNKGFVVEDFVFCVFDGFDDFGFVIVVDSCDGEGIWDDVGVWFEDKVNFLCVLVDGEGEIEFRVSMNLV